jgi:hypothetical protein
MHGLATHRTPVEREAVDVHVSGDSNSATRATVAKFQLTQLNTINVHLDVHNNHQLVVLEFGECEKQSICYNRP